MKKADFSFTVATKVSLYSSRPDLHDRLAGKVGDFSRSFGLIKKLLSRKNSGSFIVQVPITASREEKYSNYFRLNDTLKFLKKLGVRRLEFLITPPREKISFISLKKIAACLSKARYAFLFDFLIKITNLPHCLINEPEGVVSENQGEQGIKTAKCRDCSFYSKCPGILKGFLSQNLKNEIKPHFLPREIMIEAETRCNFRCRFCFNRASFARRKHGEYDNLSGVYIKRIIDAMARDRVPVVRLTGGEPLLREDIFDLIKYAKSKNLEVRLNTNCYLIKEKKTARWLAKNLDYVLVSMHTYDPRKEDEITGVKGSFNHKIKVMNWLKEAGLKTLRVSTIATWDNIRNLEKFYKILTDIGVDKWATNRVIPLPGQKDTFSSRQLKVLARKLAEIRKDIIKKNLPLKAHIVNGAPLCADDLVLMNAVCAGARSVDGHERFVIDPRGFAKPIYYLEKNIGDPLKPLECWNHSFMEALRGYKMLPKECRRCVLLEKCKGGNRYCAYIANGNYNSKDPLMDFSNVKDFLW